MSGYGVIVKEKSKGKYRKNDGSTLITVLVGVSFMVVLASIILSVSFSNLKMKQLEYRNKRNFYEDEQVLDDVYNGLGRDISEYLAKAYNDTLAMVTMADGTSQYGSQTAAYQQFVNLFGDRLESKFGADGEHRSETLAILQSYLTVAATGQNADGSTAKQAEVLDYIQTKVENDAAGSMARYTFEGVTVRYREVTSNATTGFEATVTTDIVVEVPYISFFQDYSRVLDYVLIGNQGIYFKNADARIEGNVYAGTDSKDKNAAYQGYHYSEGKVYDGMNLYQSKITFANTNYLITKGDLNLCESDLTISAPGGKKAVTNLWAENIRTVENNHPGVPVTGKEAPANTSTLSADANFYLADDLELNARGSSASLRGNYYGYNNNRIVSGINSAYETTGKNETRNQYKGEAEGNGAAHASSSSIILNANDTTLDLTGLDSLIVTGLAYVDIKNPEASYEDTESAGDKLDEYQTGESLALRYNQLLYLAPQEILYETNPVEGQTKNAGAADYINVKEACPPVGDEKSKLTEWFGSGELNPADPVTAVEYKVNGKNYVYFYLNFQSESNKAKYVEEVMKAVEPAETSAEYTKEKQKWELKQSVLKRAEKARIESNIQIDGSGCKIYTKGAVTSTTDGSAIDNTAAKPEVYTESLNMAKHFVYFTKRLDPAEAHGMVDDALDLDSLNSDISAKGLSEAELPAGYFVKFDNIVNDKDNMVKGYQVIVRTINGSAPTVINQDVKGIIICKGDVIINGSIEGLVIAGGKITVSTSGTIKANRGIVQTILEAEQKELSGIKEDKVDRDFLAGYASYYFRQALVNDTLVSETNHKYNDTSQRITSTEYTDFMYYENWQKGERH